MFRLTGALAIAVLCLAGCQKAVTTAAPSTLTPDFTNPYNGLGCGAQLPAAFRIQALLPSATLSIQVNDASGSPVPSAPLSLSWSGDPNWVSTGPIAGCIGVTALVTNTEGRVVVGRMKIGTYYVALLTSANAYDRILDRASGALADGQTAEITLTKP